MLIVNHDRDAKKVKVAPKSGNLRHDLANYKHNYLRLRQSVPDKSSTRIIVNHLLTDVLKYKELVNIKTEFPVDGGYIDYLVGIGRKKLFVVEVKSLNTSLGFRHLRQATYYALSAGVDTVVLTNAVELRVYKLKYSDHLVITELYNTSLTKFDELTISALAYLKGLKK